MNEDSFFYEDYQKCRLPSHESELINIHQQRNKCRKLCKCHLMTKNKNHAKMYVRSQFSVEEERYTHVASHYYMICPFSEFRFYWEYFMMVCLTLELYFVPFAITIHLKHQMTIQWAILFFETICCIDIILHFMTGFYKSEIKEIVLEPKLIALRYLRTYLVPDLLGTIPLEMMLLAFGSPQAYVRCASMLKAFLFFGLFRNMNEIQHKAQYSLFKFRTFQILIVLLTGAQWGMCSTAVGHIVDINPPEKYYQSIRMVYWMSCGMGHVLGVSKALVRYTGFEFLAHVLIIMFGFVIRKITFVQILMLCEPVDALRRKYTQLLRELDDYMHYKLLPQAVRRQVLDYYFFVFKLRFYDEFSIMAEIPEGLRGRIIAETFGDWFETEIFKGLPRDLKVALTARLQVNIFLVDDELYRCDEEADAMYFLKVGTVAAYNRKNVECFHLEEKAYFGESCLLFEKQNRIYTMKAAETCLVFQLSRRDFLTSIGNYPVHYDRICESVLKRYS